MSRTGQYWIDRLRRQLYDEAGDLITGETYDKFVCRWSPADLVGYFNAAREELCARKPICDRSSDVATVSVDTTGEAALHSSVLWVDQVVVDSIQLARTTDEQLEAACPSYPDQTDPWRLKTGSPTHWIVYPTEPLTLRLYPLPTSTVSAALSVHRNVAETLTTGTLNNTLADDLSERDGLAVLWWAMSLAFERDDQDTYDPSRAALCAQRFENLVGPRMDPRDIAFQQQTAGAPPRRTRAYAR